MSLKNRASISLSRVFAEFHNTMNSIQFENDTFTNRVESDPFQLYKEFQINRKPEQFDHICWSSASFSLKLKKEGFFEAWSYVEAHLKDPKSIVQIFQCKLPSTPETMRSIVNPFKQRFLQTVSIAENSIGVATVFNGGDEILYTVISDQNLCSELPSYFNGTDHVSLLWEILPKDEAAVELMFETFGQLDIVGKRITFCAFMIWKGFDEDRQELYEQLLLEEQLQLAQHQKQQQQLLNELR